jgi:hypothetical protein
MHGASGTGMTEVPASVLLLRRVVYLCLCVCAPASDGGRNVAAVALVDANFFGFANDVVGMIMATEDSQC